MDGWDGILNHAFDKILGKIHSILVRVWPLGIRMELLAKG